MSPTTNAESLRADSARVRARMLAAARDRMAAGGLDLSMNAVAKAAGVGVGTVYRHFPTRQALLEALAAQSLETLVATAVAAAREPDVGTGLAALLRAGLRIQLSDPALAEVLAAVDAVCAETLDLSRDLAAAIATLLDRARTEGAIRPDLTADDLRRLLCGLQHAVRIGATDDDADRYLDILLAGLRP
ncbi:helix-turn-helix domain-containing protein [Micromonospora echinospora]|uniref:TetR/AcrR family transcriptional regulator n=1 Tax=Micromonospora echinospora TaxID=1877 RepID=UPI0033E030ED